MERIRLENLQRNIRCGTLIVKTNRWGERLTCGETDTAGEKFLCEACIAVWEKLQLVIVKAEEDERAAEQARRALEDKRIQSCKYEPVHLSIRYERIDHGHRVTLARFRSRSK